MLRSCDAQQCIYHAISYKYASSRNYWIYRRKAMQMNSY